MPGRNRIFEKRSGFVSEEERIRNKKIREQGGEPIGEYFNGIHAKRPVLRHELASILAQYHRARMSEKFWRKVGRFLLVIWKWLTRPFRSGPVVVDQHLTEKETEKPAS